MEWEEIAAAGWRERKRRERGVPTSSGCAGLTAVYPDVVGRAGLSQPAAHGMQNIMLRRRAGTDAPYLHHRQPLDAPDFQLHPGLVLSFGGSRSKMRVETPIHANGSNRPALTLNYAYLPSLTPSFPWQGRFGRLGPFDSPFACVVRGRFAQ